MQPVATSDGVLEDCPRPRGQLEDKKSRPWPCPRRPVALALNSAWPWPRSLVLDDLAPVTFNQRAQVKVGLTLHYNVILISTML